MRDEPSDNASEKPAFDIPPITPAEQSDPAGSQAFKKALHEQQFYGVTDAASRAKFKNLNRAQRFVMKPALFLFVIGLNVWWDVNVRAIIWQAGRASNSFHLNDSVLIALLTTSIANFLALLVIVAKHLFPNSDEDHATEKK